MEGPAVGFVAFPAFVFLLSTIVFYLLLSIKHKDFTVYLKIGLVFYDLIYEISTIVYFFLLDSLMSNEFTYIQALNQTQLIYSRFIHPVQILYIAYAIYLAITKKSIISTKGILKFAILSNFLALGIAFTYLILIIKLPDSSSIIFEGFYLVFQDIPSILVGVSLIWFYYHIRNTLKEEFLLTIPIVQQKRAIAKQLIFYPIVYFICVCIYLIGIIALFISLNSQARVLVIYIMSIVYPMLNSVVYGISNSTKRFMYAICLRDKEYEDIEEIEHELRNENLLAPRVYCDLMTNRLE
jgi:hypothetical protein